MNYYDCIVVGLGCVGIGAIRSLSEQNISVLGLEKESVVNTDSTSYGQSRLFRLAYENSEYVPILKNALKDWKKIENKSDNKLFYNSGTLKVGYKPSSRLSKSINTCEERNIDYKKLNGDEIAKIFDLDENYDAIYQKNSGILDAQSCLRTQLKIAKENGVIIKDNCELQDWEVENNKIHIKTESKQYKADSLIITTGAWAYEQIDILKDKLEPKLHTYTHFITEDQKSDIGFTIETQQDEPNMYGLVEPKINAVKIGVYSEYDENINLSDFTERGYRSEIHCPEIEYASDLFNISTDKYTRDSCIITNTKDDNPIIDYINKEPNVILGVGMSGHGFKYSNIIGKIISSMIIEDYEINYNIPDFTISRF